LRTSKSAETAKVGRAISTQWRQAMTLCPLPLTEVAGTFAAVTTRLSDVITSCVKSSTSTRGNKALESECLFEYLALCPFGTSQRALDAKLLALPEFVHPHYGVAVRAFRPVHTAYQL